jgi:hypothetical protein
MNGHAGSVAVMAVVALAGCSRGPGNLTGKTTHGRFGSGTASGDCAVAQAGGTVYSPSQVNLKITANPARTALVTWTMTCTESGGGAGEKSGQSTMQLPATKMLPLPAASSSCIVAANAQLHASGTLNMALYNGAVPTASPATTTAHASGTTTTEAGSASAANGSSQCGAPPYG